LRNRCEPIVSVQGSSNHCMQMKLDWFLLDARQALVSNNHRYESSQAA
jgi:hypothetical protein